jgi:hypothetical protein
MSSILRVLDGMIVGRLQVSNKFRRTKNLTFWFCNCSCGNGVWVRRDHLTEGRVKSCGCLQRDVLIKIKTTHGMSKTRIYRIWAGMINRCTNINNPDYYNYGGRGIVICPEWFDFEIFYKDVGESYLKHVKEFGEKNTSLDRIDSELGYNVANVRWATWAEQGKTRGNCNKTSTDIIYHKYLSFFRAFFYRMRCGRMMDNVAFIKNFGCSIEDFRKYIESQFTKGMTWDNWGKYSKKNPKVWNLDHIIPCYKFDFSKEEDRLTCFHYTNLRPVWGLSNITRQRVLA